MNTKHLTIIMHKSYYNLLLDIQCACNPSAHSSGRKPHDEMNSKAPELLMQHMYIINDLVTSLTHTHTHTQQYTDTYNQMQHAWVKMSFSC